MRLDLLGAERFLGVGRATHDVGNAGDLINGLLGLLAGGVKLAQHEDELLDRPEGDRAGKTAIGCPDFRLGYRDEIHILGVQHVGDVVGVARIPAFHLHVPGDQVDALGRQVELVGQAAIDRKRIDRHEPARQLDGLAGRGDREKVCQAERIVDLFQDHAVVIDEMDPFGFPAPDFPAGQVVLAARPLLVVMLVDLRTDQAAVEYIALVLAGYAEPEGVPWALVPAFRRAVAIVAPAYGFEGDAFVGESFCG